MVFWTPLMKMLMVMVFWSEDCDDTDPLSTIYLTDMDCDGYLNIIDEDADGDSILGKMIVMTRI